MTNLLEVRDLTVRFGGLTAVQGVSFSVEQGKIFSLIGPNGAGKTTVFNAVTGVHPPSGGEVLFEGRNPRRSFRRRVLVSFAVVGLLVGGGLAVLSADVDAAWRSVILLNYPDPSEPFPVRKALGDFKSFLAAGIVAERDMNRLADLEVREKRGKHLIRGTGNKEVLETFDEPEAAERRLEVLSAMVNLCGSLRTTAPEGGRWVVRGDDGAFLESFDSREAARRRLVDLASRAGKLPWRLATRVSAMPLGFASSPSNAARQIRLLYEALGQGAASPVEERDGKGVILSFDRARVLSTLDSVEDARERVKDLVEVAAKIRGQRIVLVVCFAVGLALGTCGACVVWRRARGTPDIIARKGLARTFQNIRVFPDMTAAENVLMGMHAHLKPRSWQMAFRTPAYRREERGALSRALELLEFVGLRESAGRLADHLSYGDQRRLEIARALATRPSLLLLDEPAAGMNPSETVELMELIHRIRDTGVTVLLIEHDMKVVMGISDRVAVLDYGRKIAEGTPAEVRSDPRVIEAYLGKEVSG